jgi:hypothetical protein
MATQCHDIDYFISCYDILNSKLTTKLRRCLTVNFNGFHGWRIQNLVPVSKISNGKAFPELNLTKHHAMKMYGGSGGIAPPFLISALDGDELLASHPGRFTSGNEPPVPIYRS